jgi:hypothetical protein
MPFRKPDGPLSVHVPTSGADRPSWMGVGAIAIAGFVIGVAWPRLAGVRLGPSVPEGTSSASVAEPGAPSGSVAPVSAPVVPRPSAAPGSTSAPGAPGNGTPGNGASAAAPNVPAAAIAPASASRLTVSRGAIFSCKGAGGEVLKGNDCGTLPALDALVQPRLRKLADCSDAANTTGKLRLTVRADFAHDAITVDLGRDKDHDRPSTADALLVCAKTALASASLEGIAHEQTRYSVSYSAIFTSGGAASATTPPAVAVAAAPATPATPPPSDGTAQVEWEVAIVRDAPKTGKVIAKLQRGTAVHVGSLKDGWYPVKYGDGFATDGWLYRGAIGR